MSDIDKLSWLVLGRASDGAGRADTALLQRAALALLVGRRARARPTGSRTRSASTRSRCASRRGRRARTTIVSVGKQISKRWYVGYERGLNATTGSWQLIYRIAQRFTLRAQAGGDNVDRPDLDAALEVTGAVAPVSGRDVEVGLADVVLHEGVDGRRGVELRRIEVELALVRARARGAALERRLEVDGMAGRPRIRRGSGPARPPDPARAFPRVSAWRAPVASESAREYAPRRATRRRARREVLNCARLAPAADAPLAVVQWIERPPPKRQIQVRFLSAGPVTPVRHRSMGARPTPQ